MKVSLSSSLLVVVACLLLQQQQQVFDAFSVRRPVQPIVGERSRSAITRRGNPPTLQVAAEYETVSDVQEAVDLQEALDQNDDDDDTTVIRVKNELMQPQAISKEDLLNDVQEMMEAEPLVEFDQDDEAEPTNSLWSDIASKFQFLPDTPPELEPVVTDMDTAATSASLYMNPATAKIAGHVKITWEPAVAETLKALEKVGNPRRPFMVGIVGIPGSGKSTSAEIIQAYLGEDRSLIMPMDGFHIPLAELAELEHAADAIYRRGAPDTFHAAALKDELARIAYSDEPTVSIPGFDHAVGDPTPNQHTFHRETHRIVLCEGLYLLHDDDGWEDIKSFFDWTIYIDADVNVCIERLKERNKCIPVRSTSLEYNSYVMMDGKMDCAFLYIGYLQFTNIPSHFHTLPSGLHSRRN